LTLVAPKRFPDADAVAMAAGAAHLLDTARCVGSLDAALENSALAIGLSGRPREFAGRVLSVRNAAHEATEYARRGEVALVFGTEMSGLTNEELARCSIVATIPSNSAYASLNLAAAVQVVAYELRMAVDGSSVWSERAHPRATYDELEGLHAHAQRTLTSMAF